MPRELRSSRWLLAIPLTLALVATLGTNAVAGPAPATQDAAASQNWSTDGAHTEINFSVSHFFTPVTGTFEDYEIDLDYNAAKPEASRVEARIKVASVNTGNGMRDDHLRTADWFEADKYPHMTFKSTSVRQAGEDQPIATGPLTIKGQSHEVELPITLLGKQMIPKPMQAMLGGAKEVASFKAAATIDRADFGVGVGDWAATMVVGGQVKIEILVEAHNI